MRKSKGRGAQPLSVTHPGLCLELADRSLSEVISKGSTKKVSWRCSKGHVWDATPSNRIAGRGCPYCSGKRVLPGFNDLATTHPELAAQLANPGLAKQLTYGMRSKVEWRCDKGHVWEETPANRVHGCGCPYCSGKRVLPGFNDLATTHPEIAAQLVDASLGASLTSGSHKRVLWRCDEGHEWAAPVYSRVAGNACPYCSGRRAVPSETDLATVNPDLAAQLVDVSLASELTASSNRVVEWRCEKGHVWSSTVANRTSGKGCPYCAGRAVLPGFNDLATVRPDLASQLVDSSLATKIGVGHDSKVAWRCECGHVWEASPNSRTSSGSGCPRCSSGSPSAAEQDLADCIERLLGDDVDVHLDDASVIAPYELDVFVPSKMTAIEFNGCYWHSDVVVSDKNRHADKLRACADMGIRLVQVWEDDWVCHRDLVLRLVAAKLGASDVVGDVIGDSTVSDRVYARKGHCALLDARIARKFLDENHIQGKVAATFHFGFFDESDVLRAVLSIRSPRNNARMSRAAGEWEIQRYATHGMVVGGFSKLVKFAETTLAERAIVLNRWVSFSSNDISDGTMYRVCGFSLDAELPPDYRYVGGYTGWMRRPKERFQKRRFAQDSDLVWEDGWTESQAASANKLYRCWDSGKRRWVRPVDCG